VEVKNFLSYVGARPLVCAVLVWLLGGTAFYYVDGFQGPYGMHNAPAALYFTINVGFSVGSGPVYPGEEITYEYVSIELMFMAYR